MTDISEPDRETVDEAHFRQVLGHFPTGVAVITSEVGSTPLGLAVGSFFSVSLEPPLVGFCVAATSRSWPRIRERPRQDLFHQRHRLTRRSGPCHADAYDDGPCHGHLQSVGVGAAALIDSISALYRAVIALAPFDGPEVDAALERARQDRDWQVRQAAEDLS